MGCKFYIKEILNPKLAEKEPGLKVCFKGNLEKNIFKEGDSVLRINGQSLDGVSLDEATRLLQRSREKLSLVVQRDVRRGSNGGGGNASNRWPSQTTVWRKFLFKFLKIPLRSTKDWEVSKQLPASHQHRLITALHPLMFLKVSI